MSRLFKQAMILFLLLFAGFSFILSQFTQSFFLEKIGDWRMNQLQSQATTLESQLDQAGFLTREQWVQSLISAAEVMDEELILYDAEGQLLWGDDAGGQLAREELFKLENKADSFIRDSEYKDQSGDLYVSVAKAITASDGQLLGFLQLRAKESDLTILANMNRFYIILFILACLLVVVFYLTYWTRMIIRPLDEIKRVTDQLSEQNYASRYRGHHFHEVDQLGGSINKLAAKLEMQLLELEHRNNQLNKLIEHLNIGIMLLDENRRIKIVNPAMSQILELNTSYYINRPYIHVFKNPWIIELIENAFDSKTSQSQEIVLENSEKYILDTNIIPVHLSQDMEFGLIIIFYDLTEIRRLEKVRTDFVANASHELRTPVTALKGFTETLLDGALEDRDTLIQFLQIMQDESERLDSIIADILQLSRLEQKNTSIAEESINISQVVKSIFKILKQKADGKKISLELTVLDDMDIIYSKNALKQILMNLINNAILYNQTGGRVEVKIEDEGDEAKIAVIDNGIGIQESEQQRIFERFYRVDKARSRNAGGTGLGLSIVRHMVENSGGRLILDSVYGQGSCFTIFLKKKGQAGR